MPSDFTSSQWEKGQQRSENNVHKFTKLSFVKEIAPNHVIVNRTKSDLAPVGSGIPQGTVPGPTLFLMHVNDMSAFVESKVVLFAGDKSFIELQSQTERDRLHLDKANLRAWPDK